MLDYIVRAMECQKDDNKKCNNIVDFQFSKYDFKCLTETKSKVQDEYPGTQIKINSIWG